MQPTPTPLGDRLAALRQTAGLKARELARLAGTSPAYPFHVETGRVRKLGSDHAGAFARVLGCSLEYLLSGTGEAPTKEAVLAAVDRARAAAEPPADEARKTGTEHG